MRACLHPVLGLPESEPKELQLRIRHLTDFRPLFIKFQKQFSLNIGFEVFKGTFRRLLLLQDHHVVRIANETVASALELEIEFVEHDVGENGADRTTLRCTYLTGSDLVFVLYRRSQDPMDE